MTPNHQHATVSFGKCVLQCAVPYVSSIQKQVLHAVVTPADRGIANVAADLDLSIVTVDGNQGF